MTVRRGHQAAVRHEDRQSAAQPQEHRRLHVVDVVVRSVDRCGPRHAAGESGVRETIEHDALGMCLESAVRAHRVVAHRLVLGPRHEPGGRVGHDRGDEDVGAHAPVEQSDEVLELTAAGGHDEAGDVDDGVPLGALERCAHRRGVGAVADDAAHAIGECAGGAAAVEDSDIAAAGGKGGDEAASDEGRSTQNEGLHGWTIGHFVAQMPGAALDCRYGPPPHPHGRVPPPPDRRHLRLRGQRLGQLERRLLLHPGRPGHRREPVGGPASAPQHRRHGRLRRGRGRRTPTQRAVVAPAASGLRRPRRRTAAPGHPRTAGGAASVVHR